MKKIEVKILNPESIDQAEKLMVCAARLTQRGHQISCLDDFMDLYEKPYQRSTVANLVKLPHPTIQKFGIINVVVVGASRRFLAQITRHQNEVKYMSASLQYSDYSGVEDFVIPYDLIGTGQEEGYLRQCSMAMKNYQEMIRYGVDNDSAGYCAPQGMRNILLIGATPYQWKHMIRVNLGIGLAQEGRKDDLRKEYSTADVTNRHYQGGFPKTVRRECVGGRGIR